MNARIVILAAVLSTAFVVPQSVPAEAHMRCCGHRSLCRGQDVSLELEDGSVVLRDKEGNETVEITEDARLFVNGQSVRLSRGQRDLVRDYHDTFFGIIEEAKSIGLQGVRIGAKGATLGLKAAVGVLMLLSPTYDSDDLEEHLQGDEEELNRAASKLERRAERLEERAGKLKHLHDELRGSIHELDELGWF